MEQIEARLRTVEEKLAWLQREGSLLQAKYTIIEEELKLLRANRIKRKYTEEESYIDNTEQE